MCNKGKARYICSQGEKHFPIPSAWSAQAGPNFEIHPSEKCPPDKMFRHPSKMTKITTLSKWKQIFSRKEEKNGWLVSSSHSSKKVFINFHFQPFSVFGASKFLRSFFHNFSLCTGWRVWSRIKLVKYYSGVLLQAQNWSSNWCPYSDWD